MSSKKIIAVLGATGAQGGSVAKYLLEDGTFAVRAITRNVDSQKAKDLKAAGAEVVAADSDDLRSLEKAFNGAYGVFGLTDFWALFPVNQYGQQATQDHEEKHGRNLVDAAVSAGVKHFLYSTLENTPPIHCYHWVSKDNVNKYLKTTSLPHTSLYTAFYFENLIQFGMLKKEGDGFTFNIPMPKDAKIPSYSVSETGGWALEAFKNPEKWLGKDMHLYGGSPTTGDYVEAVKKLAGATPIKYDEVSVETFESDGFRQAVGDELWLNLKIFTDDLCKRDISLAKEGYPALSNLEQFFAKNEAIKAFVSS